MYRSLIAYLDCPWKAFLILSLTEYPKFDYQKNKGLISTSSTDKLITYLFYVLIITSDIFFLNKLGSNLNRYNTWLDTQYLTHLVLK